METKLDGIKATLVGVVVMLLVILMFLASFYTAYLDRESFNLACEELGYNSYYSKGNRDFCLLENEAIEVITIYANNEYKLLEKR